MTERERMYAYWLCGIPMIGSVRADLLLARFGSPEGVYLAGKEGWQEVLGETLAEWLVQEQKKDTLERDYARAQELGIRLLLQEDAEFPERLLRIPDPPYGIFVRGKLPREELPAVAVIGARECSEYGRYVAEELGGFLGKRGIPVISGMARGIDGISQQAALSAGGTSYGVLGCGVDICYPTQNRRLYEELLKQGGLLSTYAPGTAPKPMYFPPRNRIVSGLADALVVVEARQKSGTLITVDMALEQGKEIYIVPGRITDRLSDGCNRLLTQGAGTFLSPEQFLEEFLSTYEEKQGELPEDVRKQLGRKRKKKRTLDGIVQTLEEPLAGIAKLLDHTPKSTEELLGEAWKQGNLLDIATLQRGLMELELLGAVRQNSPGHFSR